MSKTIEKYIHQLFEPENGNSKYTKTYCSEHSGNYIVYTGTTIGVFGKVDSADYSTPNLTFTTDGEKAGTLEYITDEGYCIGGHRTILKPLSTQLDLLYFKFILQPLFYSNVKRGDVPSLHFNRIKNKKVLVPIKDNGEFDLERQKELAQRYKTVEAQKENLLKKINHLKLSKVLLENATSYVEVKVTDLFTPKNGNSAYTKEWCQTHLGSVPLYSGNTFGAFAYIDIADYKGEYITWAKDGLAGFILYHNGEFSLTGHRGILLPTEKCKNIDLLYIKFILEPIFRANIKGRLGINGKNEYTTLNTEMIKKIPQKLKIPIKPDGTFDLEKQKELAQKYATIDSIKDDIYNKVTQLTSMFIV